VCGVKERERDPDPYRMCKVLDFGKAFGRMRVKKIMCKNRGELFIHIM